VADLVAIVAAADFLGFFLAVFTREYTQCFAGYTFCFVVVVGVVGVVTPLIKLGTISADS
jgi:hypothetical protein